MLLSPSSFAGNFYLTHTHTHTHTHTEGRCYSLVTKQLHFPRSTQFLSMPSWKNRKIYSRFHSLFLLSKVLLKGLKIEKSVQL